MMFMYQSVQESGVSGVQYLSGVVRAPGSIRVLKVVAVPNAPCL
jgi:hypothetical protein